MDPFNRKTRLVLKEVINEKGHLITIESNPHKRIKVQVLGNKINWNKLMLLTSSSLIFKVWIQIMLVYDNQLSRNSGDFRREIERIYQKIAMNQL